jgi:pimeloyl-ACP methyl ester carboxylesterase
MNGRPALIDTPLGPIGAALTEPTGAPTVAALILPGGGRRTGPNRLWGRLARSLADSGALVARIDLPGHGDSDLIAPSKKTDLQVVGHVARWFSGQSNGLDLLVIGGCYGSRLVGPLVEEASVARLALIAPYLRTRYPNVRAASRRGRAARWMVRRRPSTLDTRMVRALAGYSRKSPLWVLVGEHDVAARYVGALRDAARDKGSVEIETIEGLAIHTHSSAQSQEVTIRRVTNWMNRHVKDGAVSAS